MKEYLHLPKIKIFGVTVMLVIAAYIGQARADPMADWNKKLATFKAESNAKMEAAKAVQVARFKAHPEQLNDLKRCDWDKFDGNDDEKWRSTSACQDVSGLKAQRERIRAEWHTIECANIKNCQMTIRELREGIESIRRQRADAKLYAGEQSIGFNFMPEPYSPCGITILACNPDPATAEAFREVEQYYRNLLRESDDRLNEAQKLLGKKKQQDNFEDQLLDTIDR